MRGPAHIELRGLKIQTLALNRFRAGSALGKGMAGRCRDLRAFCRGWVWAVWQSLCQLEIPKNGSRPSADRVAWYIRTCSSLRGGLRAFVQTLAGPSIGPFEDGLPNKGGCSSERNDSLSWFSCDARRKHPIGLPACAATHSRPSESV